MTNKKRRVQRTATGGRKKTEVPNSFHTANTGKIGEEGRLDNRIAVLIPIPRLRFWLRFLSPHFLFAGLCIAFFWSVLFGQEQFAYRDGAHVFYPQFEYIQSELQAGRLPLWMPYENLGQPLAANPIWSVFYPVKLIFFLPIDYVLAYHLFVVMHVWLAALMAYRLARHWKCSELGAVFAGICYAFGGSVLFLHTNVPFLIGSAWLPEAILAADRLLILHRHKGVWHICAVWLAIVVSLMTLGGDIQCVYHSLLMIGLLVFLRRKRIQWYPFLQASVLTGILIFLLTAVQTIPFLEATRLSDRVTAQTSEPDEMIAIHEGMRYELSAGPWQWIEYVWPNIDGQSLPINTRWNPLFLQHPGVWMPSLYMGLGPVLLAMAAYRLRRRNAVHVWTISVLCVSLLASCGFFGIGWLLTLFGVNIASLGISEPFGGVYWLMVNVLPGYGMFRYPAKLLSVAALPLCIMAADGFDLLFSRHGDKKRFHRRLGWLIGILCVAAICLYAVSQTKAFWSWIDAHSVPEIPSGRMIVPLAKWQFEFSILHFFLLMMVTGYFMWRTFRTVQDNKMDILLRFAFIALLVVDLFVANTCLILTAPRSVFQESLVNFKESANVVPPVRYFHIMPKPPREFLATASESRLTESTRWQRECLFTKFNLRYRIANANEPGTFYVADYLDRQKQFESVMPDEFFASLGVQYVLLPTKVGVNLCHYPGVELAPLVAPLPDGAMLCRVKNPRPRTWVEQNGQMLESAKAEIVLYEPGKVVIEVSLLTPGTVVLADQFFPGWRAKVEPSNMELPIRRVETVFRGVDFTDAGQYRLTFVYDPMSFRVGAMLTLIGIVLTALISLKRPGAKPN